ncbi:hypothetical protein STEG23_013896 [Scotinomys teguina]
MWTKDQQLSRNPPGLWCLSGTVELLLSLHILEHSPSPAAVQGTTASRKTGLSHRAPLRCPLRPQFLRHHLRPLFPCPPSPWESPISTRSCGETLLSVPLRKSSPPHDSVLIDLLTEDPPPYQAPVERDKDLIPFRKLHPDLILLQYVDDLLLAARTPEECTQGPLVLLLLILTFGPCILSRLIQFVKDQLSIVQTMVLTQQYQLLKQQAESWTDLVKEQDEWI